MVSKSEPGVINMGASSDNRVLPLCFGSAWDAVNEYR